MKKIILFFVLLLQGINLFSQTFTSNPNQSCGEGSMISFPLTVSGLPNAMNSSFGFYEVCININHPKAADLRLRLESPNSTIKTLINYRGGNANYNNTCFRIFATESIINATAPFNGEYMSEGFLKDFLDGQNPNGTWTLQYLDNDVNSITGNLISWSIRFVANPLDTAINNSSTNIPIFKFNIPLGYIPDDPKTNGTLSIINNTPLLNEFNSTTPTNVFNIAIEKQGYTSAGGEKPNYDLEIQNFNFTNDSAIQLLGLPIESDWILKSCYTDEFMKKDPLTFEMSRRMGYYAPRTMYCELMINGVYAGLYILEEKIKRDANRINIANLAPIDTAGIELTGGYIIEINPNGDPPAWFSQYNGYQNQNLVAPYEYKLVYPKQNSIPPQQLNYIHSFVDSFENVLQSSNFQNPITGWRKYASENDLINFLIVSEYSTNYDTYGRSTYLYKEKATDGGKLHCGPPWDADRGYVYTPGWVHIITHGYWIFPFWWQKLRTDPLFNQRLSCRFSNLRKDVLTDLAFDNFIDSTQNFIKNGLQRNFQQWNNFIEDDAVLKDIVHVRLDWMQNNLTDTAYIPLPIANSDYCVGEPIDIFIGNQYKYNFAPGPDTSYFLPTQAGYTNAEISTTQGCKTIQPITIHELPNPLIVGNANPCENAQETYVVNQTLNSTFQWTVNGGMPINGCGINDTFCTVQWATPLPSFVKVNQLSSANCSDSMNLQVTIQICTGIEEHQKNNTIVIFPSPANDFCRIETLLKIKQTEIFDLNGKCIQTFGNEKYLDIKTLNAGIYILKIVDVNQHTFAVKLIKK